MIGEIFRNAKRQDNSPDRDGEPLLKLKREKFNNADDDLAIQESEGQCINNILPEKVEHAFFDTTADNIRLQKLKPLPSKSCINNTP